MQAPLKEVIKKYNKNGSFTPKPQIVYVGEFSEDRRHGWGVQY